MKPPRRGREGSPDNRRPGKHMLRAAAEVSRRDGSLREYGGGHTSLPDTDAGADRHERDGHASIGGRPNIVRNSSVELVTGNGSFGTGKPRRSQIGSHPSLG